MATDETSQRIVIRSTNWLGDAVMSIPAVVAIQRHYRNAHVAVLTQNKLTDLWKIVPEVNEVIAFSPRESVFSVASRIGRKFDLAVVFPNSTRAALETFIAGVPRRIGYRANWRRALLNEIVSEPDEPRPPEHEMHHYLRLAESLGADVSNPAALFSSNQPPAGDGAGAIRIGICPGAEYGPAKRWLPERFAAAALEVSGRRASQWVLFGTASDASAGELIAGDLKEKCTNLIGKTTLAELIEQLRQCHLLLTNDTGTMHLAGYLGVPTVSLFGSTEPALTGPIGPRHRVLRHHVECSPCFLRTCPLDFRCMKAIEVDEVAEAVIRAVEK